MLGALLLLALFGSPVAQEPDQPPNLIFILADDLGYGDLGCFGQRTISTPALDRMAEQGMRLTHFYAGSTVCAPSRCTLMTGMHTGHCRVRGNGRVPLQPDDLTVAELLQSAGYTTGLIGKWGLGLAETTGIPNSQGFDYFFGYLSQVNAHNYYPEYLWRNQEKVLLKGNKAQGGVSSLRSQYSHDLFTEEAMTFVRKHHDEPFFLYLAYTIPHANNERGRKEGNGMEVPDWGPYADREWPEPQKGHAAMIHRLDRDVGRLLTLLQDLEIASRTLVIFSSDNGPHKEGGAKPDFFDSNGVHKGIKRALYDGGIRVPTLAWWPGTVKPGSVCDTPGAFWDFLPTAAEVAGVEVPEGLDGVSLLPLLRGAELPKRPPLYWEFHERGFHQALRFGPWKAVRRKAGPVEIYHLIQDPGETKNLAEGQPEILQQAQDLLASSRSPSEHWPGK
ncbi:MAG: N-acetylgalactosamine-6-sulfatase [Planctomycetota bacterium]|nr:MAG: N-acetylgalactosamine-6-sulfatase [Planctomycetota bacterium]